MLFRDTWAEIRLDRIEQNIKILQAVSRKDFFAVIKANGYGCSDEYIAKVASECGAAYLAVSSLDEALYLKNKGVFTNILVLEYIPPQALSIACKNGITATASSLNWVKEAINTDITGLKVHIKYDTGMNRIGFKTIKELNEGIHLLQNCGVDIEGIYTHFACADSEDNLKCKEQIEYFQKAISSQNCSFRWIHCSNTDAAVHFNDNTSNAVRYGIGMLGVSSYNLNLKPVVSLYSRIVHIKQVKQGESIGYGLSYHAVQDEWIATIPIGYADGWIRKNQGRCCVVNGCECEFVGKICMDQAMVRVPQPYPIGTIVELIGEHMPIDRVAKELDTIPYEVMTLISDRVTRQYCTNIGIIDTLNRRFSKEL